MDLLDKLDFYQSFLSADKSEALRKGVALFRDNYGIEWKDRFCETYPAQARIIDLCANYTAEEAYTEIANEFMSGIGEMRDGGSFLEKITAAAAEKNAPALLEGFKPGIMELHAKIRGEIDRPR